MNDKKIIVGAFLLIILIIVLGLLFFKGGILLNLGLEKSLAIARSQVQKALPEAYPSDKILKEFDTVVNNVKSGTISIGKVKDLLVWMPSLLKDSKLDSTEVDSLLHRLQSFSAAPK